MNAYKFSSSARTEAPDMPILEKAFSSKPLNREEKNKVANLLYGIFGAQGPTYRLLGWAWDMTQAEQMRRILVNVKHYGWQEYFAPDKTSLRRACPHAKWFKEMIYL